MSTGAPTPYLGLHTYDTLDDFVYSEVNADNLAVDQAIAKLNIPTVTSTTRPTTNLYENKFIWESDTQRLMRYDGAAWKMVSATRYADWDHQWSGGSVLSVGSGAVDAKFRQDGDNVDFYFNLTRAADTNFGAANTAYTWKLPTPSTSFANFLGMGSYVISGTPTPVYIYLQDSQTMVLNRVSDSVRVGNGPALQTWGTNDRIHFRGSYRAATAL